MNNESLPRHERESERSISTSKACLLLLLPVYLTPSNVCAFALAFARR